MPRETKLTQGMIDQICKYVKLRMKMKEIAEILGLHPGTIQSWIRNGKKAKSGMKKQLVTAVEQAKSELMSELSEIVFNAAFIGSETITEKEITLPDGSTRRETTTKQSPPSASYAMKVLALMDPARWGQVQQIKIDWQTPVRELGLDASQIEQAFFRYLENNPDERGTIVIPELPDRQV